jgi:hypothetical protein
MHLMILITSVSPKLNPHQLPNNLLLLLRLPVQNPILQPPHPRDKTIILLLASAL